MLIKLFEFVYCKEDLFNIILMLMQVLWHEMELLVCIGDLYPML
jgi:hypothetical protein